MKRYKSILMIIMVAIVSMVMMACQSTSTTTMMTTTEIETTTEDINAIEDIDEILVRQTFDVHRENYIKIVDDRIITFGENGNGQLGVGDKLEHLEENDITDAFELGANETIIDVGLGEYHAMALSNQGRVFSWGHNAFGKLGLPRGNDQLVPLDITEVFDLNDGEIILHIEVGRDHNGVITSEGRVFVFGVNAYGQLGIGQKTFPWEAIEDVPIDITERFNLDEHDFIIDLDFGNNHSAALSYRGEMFVWGDNELNQLGIDEVDVVSPYNLTDIFFLAPDDQIIDIDVGYEHTGMLTRNGRVFIWGDNEFNQLGIGPEIDQSDGPIVITSSVQDAGELLRIRLDHNSSVIIGSEDIYVFGYNFNFQLGLGHNNEIFTPTLLGSGGQIVDMIVAKEFFMILDDQGNLSTEMPN